MEWRYRFQGTKVRWQNLSANGKRLRGKAGDTGLAIRR